MTLKVPRDDAQQQLLDLQLYSTKTTNFEEDIDYEEYRMLNLKRNLYGYNSSFSHR